MATGGNHEQLGAAHRHVAREGARTAARRLGRKKVRGPRTVEAYLRAESPPRYMTRLREIENEYRRQRRRLEEAYASLVEELGHDAHAFAERWHRWARTWRFDELNELIRQHNAWYPVEADLPMDPRTRDFVPVHGESYRRAELGPEWVLRHFPPTPLPPDARPDVPGRPPREPR